MEENKNIEPEQPPQNITEEITSSTENISQEAETAATQQPQTTNSQLQTEQMEVHHHTHPGHHKKKWTDYFWEFLMLFLAVFCGFLAEYQLEHVIENSREKQYINSLLDDLREDTAALSTTIKSYHESEYKNDSLIRLLTSVDVKTQGSALYYLGRAASRSPRLAIRDATIQQLKNSGGLRLIGKGKVSKAIIEYYNRLVFIDYLQKIEDDEIMEYRKMAVDIFHPVIFNALVTESNEGIMRPAGNPSLLTYDSTMLLRAAGMVSYIRNTRIGLANLEAEMSIAAIDLIRLIKEEYHLQ